MATPGFDRAAARCRGPLSTPTTAAARGGARRGSGGAPLAPADGGGAARGVDESGERGTVHQGRLHVVEGSAGRAVENQRDAAFLEQARGQSAVMIEGPLLGRPTGER